MDRPEVRVEMLKTNRNDVVEQSLGEVNLAMMVSLTMVVMNMVWKWKCLSCQTQTLVSRVRSSVVASLKIFLISWVSVLGIRRKRTNHQCIAIIKEKESSLLYFTWPKWTKRSRPEGIPRHGRDHGTRNRDVRIWFVHTTLDKFFKKWWSLNASAHF